MKMTAFWRYDLFPFVLSGEVKQITIEGDKTFVTPKGLNGYQFDAVALLPGKQGEQVAERLKTLRVEYDAALEAFNEEWKAKARDVIPFDPPSYLLPKKKSASATA